MPTIKELIERGAYPKDDKGRALVPLRNGKVATILSTDLSIGHFGIIGHRDGVVTQWMADGHEYSDGRPRSFDLLPPPPRKTPFKARLRLTQHGWVVEYVDHCAQLTQGACVTLTGEYEEPWDA